MARYGWPRRQSGLLLVARVKVRTTHCATTAVLLALLLAAPNSGHAETRCNATALAHAAAPYPYKSRGSYCDGTYQGDVGGGIDLIGVTRGLPSFDHDRTQISLPSRSHVNDDYSIFVLPTMPGLSYRLDTYLKLGQSLAWSTSELKRNVDIANEELTFGALNTRGEFAALCVHPSVDGCRSFRVLHIVLRAAGNYSGVVVRYLASDQNGHHDSGTKDVAQDGVSPNEPVAFDIPIAPTTMRVEISVELQGPNRPAGLLPPRWVINVF
jgi:hypothetical protein